MTDQALPVTEMSEEECREILATRSFGRIGYILRGEVHIVPINYVMHEGELVFRTADDSKFYALEVTEDVGFEIDEVTEEQAWSILARGSARALTDDSEAAAAAADLHPWVPTEKRRVMAVTLSSVTGRKFRLAR